MGFLVNCTLVKALHKTNKKLTREEYVHNDVYDVARAQDQWIKIDKKLERNARELRFRTFR